MSKKKKVIVIGHEASLSGAPILLLNLFRLLIEKRIVDVYFVIRKDGPLVDEYRKLAPTIVLKSTDYGIERNIFHKLINFTRNKMRLGIVLVKAFFYDYFFCNTVVNGKLLRWFYFHKKPTITYVHELEKVIDLYLRQNDAVLPLSVSKAIAFPSNTTKQLLESKYKIPKDNLKELRYYFPFSKRDFDLHKVVPKRQQLRQKFDIGRTDFVVGAMGAISERKGIDLYIDVCKQVVSVNSSIKFIWIGAFESSEQETRLKTIIKDRQLETNVIFVGPLDYSIYNFAAFDILFLSSREDTYPLVVLEAAMMKVPTICFSGSGGIVEFIKDDAGWIIEDFSTNCAADKIIELQKKSDVVHLRGDQAFDRVLNLHCNKGLIIDQYNSIIEALK